MSMQVGDSEIERGGRGGTLEEGLPHKRCMSAAVDVVARRVVDVGSKLQQ